LPSDYRNPDRLWSWMTKVVFAVEPHSSTLQVFRVNASAIYRRVRKADREAAG
jgi:hypothetical protein